MVKFKRKEKRNTEFIIPITEKQKNISIVNGNEKGTVYKSKSDDPDRLRVHL